MTTPTGGNIGDATITVNANTTAALRDLNQFSRDAQGRLRDVRGRFVSASTAARLLGDDINNTGRRSMPVLGRLGDAVRALAGVATQAAGALGTAAGGLGGSMNAVGVVAGASLLPALGAVVPAAAGVALAAGTLKVAFAGVGEAVAAAGEDQEAYAEALKKLSPPARDFTKELVAVKKEFAPFTKEIQKAALPGFTQALKDARPVMKLVGQAMTDMAEGFGNAAREAGRFMKDSGFQGALQANLKMGTQFVGDMTAAMGPFTKSLLDFGAASGPTLKAFSDGVGGLLTKGLPGFFEGLTPGIGGASRALDGLFDAVNSVLPAFGRLSGEIAKTAGPVVGEILRSLGIVGAGAMDALRGAVILLRPVVKDLGFGLRTVIDIGKIVAPTMKDTALAIINAFSGVGGSVDKAVGPLQRLNQFVNENRVGILEAARVFGGAMIDMTASAIAFAPKVVEAFKAVSIAVLSSIDGIVVGAEAAFGWVPGAGDKLRTAAAKFKEFKDGFIGNLDEAQRKGEEFAAQALPKLEQGKLKLDISNWQEQIAAAERQMKNVPPEKRAKLTADIANWKVKVAEAERQLLGAKATKQAKLTADIGVWKAKVSEAERQLKTARGDKRAKLTANIDDWRKKISAAQKQVDNLPRSRSTTLTITTIRRAVQQGTMSSQAAKNAIETMGATGGLYTGAGFKYRGRGYANGGLVDGPGTGTSDSVFAPWLSKNEFVVNAKQTARHLPLLKAINAGQLGIARSVATVRNTAVGTMRTSRSNGSSGDLHVHLHLDNRGWIGSRHQLKDWLVGALDDLDRTNRLPRGLRGA